MEKVKRIKGYEGVIIAKSTPIQKRIMLGIPVTGSVRIEWAQARYGQTIPCNWSNAERQAWISQTSPLRFTVADARNLIANDFVTQGFEWLIFIDHDVILPPYFLIAVNERIQHEKIPIFGGLYFTKSVPSEPLIYRGRGNSYFNDWKLDDQVWVDGMGLGCHVIHRSILQVLYDESEEYVVAGQTLKKIFDTPSRILYDPEQMSYSTHSGTEDLEFYTRIIKDDILRKAGWKAIARRKWPFLCDTKIFCWHIDPNGQRFPMMGEQKRYARKK